MVHCFCPFCELHLLLSPALENMKLTYAFTEYGFLYCHSQLQKKKKRQIEAPPVQAHVCAFHCSMKAKCQNWDLSHGLSLFFFNFPNLLWHWYLSLWTEAPEKEPHLHWPFYKGLLMYSNLSEWGDFELFWIQRLITWNVNRSLVSTNRKAKDGIRQHLKPTQGFPHFAVICLPDVSTNFILLVYDFFLCFLSIETKWHY